MTSVMEAQLQFLHLLEGLRNPVFDFFFSAITHLGSEPGLILVGLFLYWCVDKKSAHYLFLVGFIGTTINQFLKLLFHVLRPWELDPTLSPIESAVPDASGFSFPSGHTQSSVGLFGGLILCFRRNRALIIGAAALCVLIPFSRLYLGVHTPQDVLASVVVAIALLFLLRPMLARAWGNRKRMLILLGAATLLSVAQLVFVCVYPNHVPEVLGENTASAYKNACTLLGAQVGLIVIYLFDECYLHFETKAPLPAQIIKLVCGAAIAFLIKALLKAPLVLLLGEGTEALVRYFLLVLFAGVLWPLSFRLLARIGAKKGEGEGKV